MLIESDKRIKSISSRKGTSLVRITIDNEDFIDCSRDLVLKYCLHKGMQIKEDTINSILRDQRIFDLKKAALNFATYKPRTSKQVIEKLLINNFTREETLQAVDFLKEFDLIDDERFARTFIKDFIKKKPSAEPRLLVELLKRGIPKDIAEQAISEIFPEENRFDLAEQAAEKKLRAIRNKPYDKQRNSLVAYLQQQGFSWDIINKIIEKYLPGEENKI